MSVGDLSLLYNNRVKGKPKKLHIEWMRLYIIEEINSNGSVRLRTLQGTVFRKLVNGARLKWYQNYKKNGFITDTKNIYRNQKPKTPKRIKKNQNELQQV